MGLGRGRHYTLPKLPWNLTGSPLKRTVVYIRPLFRFRVCLAECVWLRKGPGFQVGVSKNQGPQYRPQIAGLAKGHSTKRTPNSQKQPSLVLFCGFSRGLDLSLSSAVDKGVTETWKRWRSLQSCIIKETSQPSFWNTVGESIIAEVIVAVLTYVCMSAYLSCVVRPRICRQPFDSFQNADEGSACDVMMAAAP